MAIKSFLAASIGALAFYSVSLSGSVLKTAAEESVSTSLEDRLQKEKAKRKEVFEKGEAAFKISERIGLAHLTIKTGQTRYDITDECIPFPEGDKCKLDDKPDSCTIYIKNELKQDLEAEEAELACGDVYRQTKDEFIDFHVEKFKELLKSKSATIFLGRIGSGKAAVVTDEKTIKYSVFDQDNDGVVETFFLQTLADPLFPKLFIDKNTSKSIREKIGGLYKLVEDYVMEIETNAE